MSKFITGEQAAVLPAFNLSSFTEEVHAAEQRRRAVEEEFKPDSDQRGPKEEDFILGGFDFEYGGGYRRDEILKKTSDEADAMIREAQARVEGIEYEAAQKGHREGKEQGKQEIFTAATSLMASLKEGITQMANTRHDYYGKAEKEMVDLVILVAEEIICREIREDKEIIAGVIRKAAAELHSKQRISVRLNPADMEMAIAMKEDLIRETEVIENVELKSDTAINPGGCVLETNIGILDATLEKRILNIHESMKSRLEK